MKKFAALLVTALLLPSLGKSQLLHSTFECGGLKRSYVAYLPKGYVPERKYPLLLLLHGRFGTGEKFLQYTGIQAIADRDRFIVVAPDGYRKSWNDGRRNTPAHEKKVDDVKFLETVLDRIQGTQGVDPERIYCAGMSNGGMMTLTLAAKLENRLAAIGVIVASASQNDPDRSIPAKILPMIVMNGTLDPLIKWNGGPISARDTERIMGTEAFLKQYTERGGCSAPTVTPAVDNVDDGTSTRVHTWRSCTDPTTEVQLWEVDGGGHTLPGKSQYLREQWIGKTSRDYDGMDAVWKFLARFKLAR